MPGLSDSTGNNLPDPSDDEPLRLGEILLYPLAMAVTVVAFIYVLAYDKWLSLNPLNTPYPVDASLVVDASPEHAVLTVEDRPHEILTGSASD